MDHNKTLQILEKNLHRHLETTLKDHFHQAVEDFIQGLVEGLEKINHPLPPADQPNLEKVTQEIQRILQERTPQHIDHLIKAIEKPLIQLSLLVPSPKKSPAKPTL